ncbi:isoprenyl transferase [Caldalkalibacillus salinus]|uniref:isoprenyl transferase n=1 Tax=Caldalkalibacillus salinus TaxID=2803787 RepID=UPI00192062B4|nr:isoprenyl transferase [Caldalkalibacillus salinus]
MLQKISNLMNRQTKEDGHIPLENIPQHVAIIMDGNGRWAKQRGLPRVAGHREGMKSVREVTRAADELGVKVLTLYAFSTENWKRPKDEVDYLMKLPQDYINLELEELIEKNVQIRLIGTEEGLPKHTLEALKIAREKTQENTGLILNFALNYGSRAEIVQSVKDIATKVKTGELEVKDIDESLVQTHLLTNGLTDPDLLIRTKEIRLSNFMLWQLAYTELYFSDVYWPEFSRDHFLKAILEYQRRVRRYGSV